MTPYTNIYLWKVCWFVIGIAHERSLLCSSMKHWNKELVSFILLFIYQIFEGLEVWMYIFVFWFWFRKYFTKKCYDQIQAEPLPPYFWKNFLYFYSVLLQWDLKILKSIRKSPKIYGCSYEKCHKVYKAGDNPKLIVKNVLQFFSMNKQGREMFCYLGTWTLICKFSLTHCF